MVEVPSLRPNASPVPLIVATLVLEEDHVTLNVMSCVLLSLYLPVAVNCCEAPLAMDGLVGVTIMVCSVGAVPTIVTPELVAGAPGDVPVAATGVTSNVIDWPESAATTVYVLLVPNTVVPLRNHRNVEVPCASPSTSL